MDELTVIMDLLLTFPRTARRAQLPDERPRVLLRWQGMKIGADDLPPGT